MTIDWLVGSTRYRQEGLAENLYTIREEGSWPLLYADALKCCQLIGITPEYVLENAGKLSDKPITEPNTIVQPTENAADIYANSSENDTIYLDLSDRMLLRQNFVYFAAEKLETLKVAMDNAGTSPQFLDSLNRDGKLLSKDIKLAAEYLGVDAELALKYDLTKKTGRNLAKWFELREFDSSKLVGLGSLEAYRRKLEQGYFPNETELACIAAAFGVAPVELPIPYDELQEMKNFKLVLTDDDVQLLRNYYHLNDTGRQRLMQYSMDMMAIFSKE